MSSIDQFISQFGGLTEEYTFFGGEVTLHYEPKSHVYLLLKDGDLIPQEGVTNVCHIIDKSEALIPWACKQMAAALLNHAGVTLPDGNRILRSMSWQEFENLVLASKTAHKDKLEEAGDIGHLAHSWIEKYIKAVIYHGQDSIQVQEVLAKLPEDERAANCCMAALDWMRNHNVRWLGTERKIYSREYGYAGTMDGLCLVDSCNDHHCCKTPFKDRLTVSDWKTSNYLYIEFLLQTAAYMQAYNEEETYVAPLEGREPRIAYDRWIIRLGKEDACFDPWHAPAEDFVLDFTAFVEALRLKRDAAAVERRVKDREAQTRESIRAERRSAKEAAQQAEKERKAAERQKAKEEREAALKIKCAKADKYQGIRAPKCGCETCLKKYADVQASKTAKQESKSKLCCVSCSSKAAWIRRTQFSGNHPFCEEHAKLESDFGEENSYHVWEKLPKPVRKPRKPKTKPCDGEHPAPACGFMCWQNDAPIGYRYEDLHPQLCLPEPKVLTCVIGEYSSWSLSSCKNGHALRVPSDDALDNVILTGGTFSDYEQAIKEKALTIPCEICEEKD